AAFLSFALCVYVAASPIGSKPIYDMLLFPRCMKQAVPYAPVTWQGVKNKDCWIEVGSRKLHGWLFERPGSTYLTIIHHGQCGNITIYEPFVEFMLAQGNIGAGIRLRGLRTQRRQAGPGESLQGWHRGLQLRAQHVKNAGGAHRPLGYFAG